MDQTLLLLLLAGAAGAACNPCNSSGTVSMKVGKTYRVSYAEVIPWYHWDFLTVPPFFSEIEDHWYATPGFEDIGTRYIALKPRGCNATMVRITVYPDVSPVQCEQPNFFIKLVPGYGVQRKSKNSRCPANRRKEAETLALPPSPPKLETVGQENQIVEPMDRIVEPIARSTTSSTTTSTPMSISSSTTTMTPTPTPTTTTTPTPLLTANTTGAPTTFEMASSSSPSAENTTIHASNASNSTPTEEPTTESPGSIQDDFVEMTSSSSPPAAKTTTILASNPINSTPTEELTTESPDTEQSTTKGLSTTTPASTTTTEKPFEFQKNDYIPLYYIGSRTFGIMVLEAGTEQLRNSNTFRIEPSYSVSVAWNLLG